MINKALLMALLTLSAISVSGQSNIRRSPLLRADSIDRFGTVFPQIKNEIALALENEQEDNVMSISQMYSTFTANPTVSQLVKSHGGTEQTVSDIFIIIVGFSVLLLDEDLELIRTELGLKTITATDIARYMDDDRAASREDIKALEASLERYEQVRLWVGKENMALLLSQKNVLKKLLN